MMMAKSISFVYIFTDSGNASCPIELIDDGIETLINEVQEEKAYSSIDLIEKGIETYFNEVQPEKVPTLIDVIEEGIDILEEVQFSKA